MGRFALISGNCAPVQPELKCQSALSFRPCPSRHQSECAETFQASVPLWWGSCLEDKANLVNLSNPEIQWQFVHRKFLRGAEEGRIFIEKLFDGVWSFVWSTKTSFKLSFPKEEKGKGVGGRRRSKGELNWLCSGTLYFSWGDFHRG